MVDTFSKAWSESPNGMLTNAEDDGGIIDSRIVDGKWFIIFNDGRDTVEGIDTREEAIAIFLAVSTVK